MALSNSSATTKSLKTAEINRSWYIIDASQGTIGRVATVAAERLIGKHKPQYTPHIDNGDNVIVINAANVGITGRKAAQKKYARHSGFIGGITETVLQDQMNTDPTQVIIRAVRGMLPKNKLLTPRIARLRVYAGSEHNHSAQKPTELGVK